MAYSIVLQLLLVHVDDAVAHTVQEILRVRNHHQDTRVAENRQPYNYISQPYSYVCNSHINFKKLPSETWGGSGMHTELTEHTETILTSTEFNRKEVDNSFLMPRPPSKHARSKSEVFWLQPIMAITARIRYAGSKFSHMIQFHSSKDGPDHFLQNQPGSNLDRLVWFCPNGSIRKPASMQESPGPVLAEHNRPATSFPTFRLGCIVSHTAQTILCKTSPNPI